MLETSEQIQVTIPDGAVRELSEPESPVSDESILDAEITRLWQDHRDYQTAIRYQSQNLGILRSDLGKRLHQMKELLVKPGRGGQWSAWLKQRKIPRATADRLVAKYERSINPNGNCPTAQLAEPKEEDIQKLYESVSPKLRRVLRTAASAYRFLDLLTSSFEGVDRRLTDEGILILNPLVQPDSAVEQNAARRDDFAEPSKLAQTALHLATTARAPTEG